MSYLRICKLCGKQFESNHPKGNICKDPHYANCEYCGKTFRIASPHYPQRTCSLECRGKLRTAHAQTTSLKLYGVKNAGGTAESQAKIKATCQERYGVDWPGQSEISKQHVAEAFRAKGGNPMQRPECRAKAAETCLERYGAPSPFSKESNIRSKILQTNLDKYGTVDPGNLPEFREKAKQTSLAKYGKEWYMQTEEYKERVRQTSLETYGVEHFTQSEEVKAKQRATSLERYGVESVMKSSVILQRFSDSVQKKYGVPYFCMHPKCTQAQNLQPSKMNIKFGESVMSKFKLEVDYEFRIQRFSYDIAIASSNILIEIDPTYTHTVAPTKLGGKTKDYHIRKSKTAAEAGYHCIHIFDWDNWDKMINLFSPKKTITISDCTVETVPKEVTDDYLNQYHIHNQCEKDTANFGLRYNSLLVALICVSSQKGGIYELDRICVHPEYEIIEGVSTLLERAEIELNIHEMIAVCDDAKFSGQEYKDLGFNEVIFMPPVCKWSKGSYVLSSDKTEGMTDEELLNDGWLPIYDCGYTLYRRKEVA